jgi:hypothetical protein
MIEIVGGRMRWAGHVASTGEMRNTCNILIEKSERERPLIRPRHILEWMLRK